MDDGLDCETGYGKPPKRTQFQKGVSGNPKGRPKGSQNLATLFRKITYEKVRVNGPRGPRWMTKLEAGITQLANRAATGDPKATRELIHWIKILGEVAPILPPPIFNIRFAEAVDRQPAEGPADEYSLATLSESKQK
jgi:hypothetical protein